MSTGVSDYFNLFWFTTECDFFFLNIIRFATNLLFDFSNIILSIVIIKAKFIEKL